MAPGMHPEVVSASEKRQMDDDRARASDVALVVAVGRFDEAALAELYRRHGGRVYTLALRLLGDRTQAEEVLQDVFVRLWERPQRFDGERGQLRAFLCREAHSRAVDRLRSESARRRREDRHERERERASEPTEDLEREVMALVRSEAVRSAMEELSDHEREAIMLAYYGGHTYRDVARLLAQPEGTIKTRIRAGLGKLATRLADLEPREAR